MTWTFPPVDIAAGGGANSNSSNHTPTLPTWIEAIHCSGATCPMNRGVIDVQFFSIADALTGTGDANAALVVPDIYDWYSVEITVDFPGVHQGTETCGVFPFAPCKGDQVAFSQGQLGYWQPAEGGGYEAVPGMGFELVKYSTAETLPDFGSATGVVGAGSASAWTLGYVTDSGPIVARSLLINPNPLYPVPDDTGNTAGRALFTRAQLEALNGVLGLQYEGEWIYGTSNLGLFVDITAYVGLPVDSSGPGFIETGPNKSGVVRLGGVL